MAKSKQQTREEALARQLESFHNDLKHLIRAADTTKQYYDAEHHLLVWTRIVNSAYTARVDIHGNYLDERYYKRPWQFSKDADGKDLAENFTAFTLEELKTKKAQDGRTLFKIAYGTAPFVEQRKQPYGTNNVESMLNFILAGAVPSQRWNMDME